MLMLRVTKLKATRKMAENANPASRKRILTIRIGKRAIMRSAAKPLPIVTKVVATYYGFAY